MNSVGVLVWLKAMDHVILAKAETHRLLGNRGCTRSHRLLGNSGALAPPELSICGDVTGTCLSGWLQQ